MKKIAALALILLTGCGINNGTVQTSATVTSVSVTENVTAETAREKASETTAASETTGISSVNITTAALTTTSDAKISAEQKQTHRENAIAALEPLLKEDGDHLFYPGSLKNELRMVHGKTYDVGHSLNMDLYRESTNMYCASDSEKKSFVEAADAAKHSKLAEKLIDNSLSMAKYDKVLVTLDDNDSILNTTASYRINSVSFNGYLTEDNRIIVDPAYMYNIPVPVYCDCKYNIDGMDVMMDSISFTSDNIKIVNGAVPHGGIYGKVHADGLTVQYDSDGNNYSTATKVYISEVFTDNTELSALTEKNLEKFTQKNDGSAAVYGALINNIELFSKSDVVGVNLIDLDFDGTPEVLVSSIGQSDGTRINETNGYADVDIYTINGDKLVYVDTLYNYRHLIVLNSNLIGLKTLEDGSQKWLYVSRREVGEEKDNSSEIIYLFTLENGKLNYTEALRQRAAEGQTDTNGYQKNDYYLYGEKLTFNTYYGEPLYEDTEEWEYYEWNGITAAFGEWELWGFIERDFCKGVEPVFNLYSDWLCRDDVNYKGPPKLFVSDITLRYKLAYLTDAFFYGSYDSQLQGYVYEFLGDYAKPVIYLYPTEKTDVSVSVELDGGRVTCAYPEYNGGWNVTAYPDGTIIDKSDNEEYYCLYWEGKGNADWDMSKGFVVKREDTASFLRGKLKEMGLTPRESNEFIIYWLPLLSENECNLITFQTERYEKNAKLNISPAPDSMLRVFMVYSPCDENTTIEPQTFEPFIRNGFTVVEWGGSCCQTDKE